MILRTVGTVLGVRAMEANKTTGELSKFCTLDIYDPEDGPAEIRCPLDIVIPDVGTQVEVRLTVRAYSGFVNEKKTRSGEAVGVAGDAKVQYTAVSVTKVRAAKAA
jgi:hypothetical protein